MMVSDEPGDRELVLAAARLGWTLAELRGRVRESVSGPPLDRARPKGILPLGQERSQKEQLIEYGNVVSGLAKRLDVDVPAQTLSHAPTDVAGKSASEVAATFGLGCRQSARSRRYGPPQVGVEGVGQRLLRVGRGAFRTSWPRSRQCRLLTS